MNEENFNETFVHNLLYPFKHAQNVKASADSRLSYNYITINFILISIVV